MKILALTHRVPFPPDRGDRIRAYHLLSRLGQEHEIWLCCIDDSVRGASVHNALDSFCEEHAVFGMSPLRRYAGAIKSVLRGAPVTTGYFYHPAAQRQINAWARAVDFDAVYVLSTAMARYWQNLPAPVPAVMDLVDVESVKWGQYAEHDRTWRRWVYAREQRELSQYEIKVSARAGRTVLVSEAEVETFRGICAECPTVALPNGVDSDYFALPQLHRRADPPRLVYVGQMNYAANEDAVCHFVQDILPYIQAERANVEFIIVGNRPTQRVLALREHPGVKVTGWVEDVRPRLWEASVAVAPLRHLQGTQNKVLEAMAASVPVVATSLATRGLARPVGPHVRVADEPRRFAQEVLDLLNDPEGARFQAAQAVEMVRHHHSWDDAAHQLSALMRVTAGAA